MAELEVRHRASDLIPVALACMLSTQLTHRYFRPKPMIIVLALAFYPWWFLQLYLLFYTVLERYEMKQFYEERLGISEVRVATACDTHTHVYTCTSSSQLVRWVMADICAH